MITKPGTIIEPMQFNPRAAGHTKKKKAQQAKKTISGRDQAGKNKRKEAPDSAAKQSDAKRTKN